MSRQQNRRYYQRVSNGGDEEESDPLFTSESGKSWERACNLATANVCRIALKTATTIALLDDSDDPDYEEALNAAGYGRFHVWFLLVCGWANASDAVEVLCISFLLPAAECDLELSSSDKGWLSAIAFIGMLVGGYVWGTLGDTFGRRSILMSAMLVNAFFGATSSLAQDKYTFLVMRFLSGVG